MSVPQRRQSASSAGRKGITVPWKDVRANELQVQSATARGFVDCVLDEYEPVYFKIYFSLLPLKP